MHRQSTTHGGPPGRPAASGPAMIKSGGPASVSTECHLPPVSQPTRSGGGIAPTTASVVVRKPVPPTSRSPVRALAGDSAKCGNSLRAPAHISRVYHSSSGASPAESDAPKAAHSPEERTLTPTAPAIGITSVPTTATPGSSSNPSAQGHSRVVRPIVRKKPPPTPRLSVFGAPASANLKSYAKGPIVNRIHGGRRNTTISTTVTAPSSTRSSYSGDCSVSVAGSSAPSGAARAAAGQGGSTSAGGAAPPLRPTFRPRALPESPAGAATPVANEDQDAERERDKEYLRSLGVPQLFNRLSKDLLSEQPENVIEFMTEWLKALRNTQSAQ